MKKINFILAAFAAVFALSCNKEITNVQTPDASVPAGMKMVTLTAGIDAAETKTTYDADGKFSWTKGDQISVYCSDGKFYTFTAEADGASVNFAGAIPEDVSLDWCAFYPADAGHREVEGTYYYNFPEYKDLSTTGSADLPMGAVYSDGVYAFKHMSGAALLTFTNIPDFIKNVEISIVNSAHVISGSFKTYANDPWSWVYAGASTDSEKTLIRKVAVNNNQAQLYFPFKGQMWSTNTINITGFDSKDNEYVLLKDKTMKGRSEDFVPRTVVPYAPLALPDYVPPVDWASVDWEGENVATYVQEDWMYESYPQYSDIKELKALADEYYLYARVTPTKAVNEIRFFFADKGETFSGDLWMWENTGYTTYYKSARATVTENSFNLSYNGSAVELVTETVGENVVWNMAFPRSAGKWTTSSGSVYVGFMTYGEGFEAPIPKVFGEMLEVTLP